MGGGILCRLFQKPGSGRPAEIAQALKSKDLETEEYRRVAAACLAGLAPGNTMQSYIHNIHTHIHTFAHIKVGTYIKLYYAFNFRYRHIYTRLQNISF